MRQLRLIFAAGIALYGFFLSTEAQQPTLPANPSPQLSPLVPTPPEGGMAVQGTLQTTTVQSSRPYDPNQKVTPDQYYSLLGTTGSLRVNTDRAREDQAISLQKALRQKELKEQMSTPNHYETYDPRAGFEYLKRNPPRPDPEALAEPVATSVPAARAPSEDPPEYVKMKGSGGTLVGRIMALKARNTPEVPEATFSPPEYVPPAESNAPLPPGYPSTLAAMDDESALSESAAAGALAAPPERKPLFSRFRKKQNDEIPATDRPPAPQVTSIFRPNASSRKADAMSVITGDEVYATVEGEEVKLSPGTRVRVTRVGTDRTLVRLYDDRQAMVPNSALVPEN